MNNKKLLSILLAFLMLISNFSTVFAIDNQKPSVNPETETRELEVSTVKDQAGNKKNLIQLGSLEKITYEAQSNRIGPRLAPAANRNVTVNVIITKNGLGTSPFDWDEVFGANGKFTVYAYYLDANYNRVDLANKEISSTDTSVCFNVSLPTGINAINVETSFIDNMDIKAFETPDDGEGSGTGNFNLLLEINQIVNPKVSVVWQDPYGRPVEGTQTKATFAGTDIAVPGETKEINLRDPEDDNDEAIDGRELRDLTGKTLEVNNVVDGKVTLGGVEYKVATKLPTAKDAGEIKFESQPDVVVPPTKPDGSGDPVDPADGYFRLTFDANENKANGVTGTHTAGDYVGNQKSYIDVKEGLDYTNANLQTAIKALSTTGTKLVGTETKQYTQDAKNPWTPTVPADTTKVAKATYNAQYEKSAAEQVEELGGLAPVTIKVWKDDNIAWSKGVAPNTTNANDRDLVKQLLDKATVTDQSNRNSDAKGEYKGDLLVTFEDTSTLEVKDQMLYVYANGDEKPEDPNKPVPTDAATVTFTKDDDSIKADGWDTVKPIIVKKGTAVPEEKFPNAEAKEGYKSVTWTPAKDTVVNDDQTFNASASKNTPTTEDKDNYDPHYEDKSGKPGETVQIDKPTFTKKGEQGTVPAPTNGDKKTTFAKNDPNQTNVTVDPNTGAITVVIPQDAKVGDTITIPVDVTYPDGSNETVRVTVTVTNPDDKTKDPTIDQPYEGDKKITGKGEPESKIVVDLPDGTQVDGEVDKNGNWTVDVPVDKQLKPGDVIKATQIKDGETKETSATVKGKTTLPSFEYLTLTLDENYRGGEITHYDVYEGDLIERYLYRPRRRGYVFEGWSYNSRYLDEVRPGDRIYYSTTLYAIWSKDRDYERDEREEEPEDTREVLEHKAYMFGYTDGTVRPNGNITRAEAAALVTRLLGIESIGAATRPMFTDTPSAWYNKAINAAVQRGIMKGYPDGRFRPNAPITRAEFTQMIAQIDNKPYGIAPFADVKGHWAELAIGREYQAKRIMGYPDGTFRPNANITRCEAVVILNKMFERNYDDMSAINAMNRHLIKSFLDLSQSFWGYNDMVEATNSHDFKRRVKGRIEEDWVLVK